jgi:DNA-binding LacI/PurR family transcriptional regulator/DNA-binding transcriptional regulator YhcF (GntR family)
MKTPLYQQLYDYVLNEIRSGRLKAGDRVLSEKELAERFNVSRITSKKALEMLVQAAVIERIPGKGSFVASDPDGALAAPSDEAVFQEAGWHQPVVGVIFPDFSESYGLTLIHAIESACSERGYHMLLKRSYGNLDIERKALQAFVRDNVDGVIMFPVHGEYYNPDLLRLVLDNFPVVLVDRYLSGIPASAVYTDNRRAARLLTDYFLENGHERVGFIAPPSEHTSTIEDRLQGYRDSLIQHGLLPETRYIFTDLYSTLPLSFYGDRITRDAAALRQFIEACPEVSAFVVAEFNLARLLNDVLGTLGRREQYAFVCFDSFDEPFGRPPFTHVKQNEEEMGRTAVELLTAQFEGAVTPVQRVIDFRIVPGHSTPINFADFIDKAREPG